ncbi:MAG: ABC transporter permease [Sphingomonadaceae bacterium]
MDTMLGVFRYEMLMGVKRWGVWLATFLASTPAITSLSGDDAAHLSVWTSAATIALGLNLLTPVVGGIAMADRLHRDSRLGVSELMRVTLLPRPAYVLGKYLGAVGATLTPLLVVSLVTALSLVVMGAPPTLLVAQAAAFLVVNVPACLFVGAFSLACPAVLPLRVYQVLFTGYWFWGNFLNPNEFPTLNGSLLTPYGEYAASGILASSDRLPYWNVYSFEQGVASIALLVLCAAAALFALDRCLALQEART